MNKRVTCTVSGRVQRVLYRDTTRRKARSLQLAGFVQNQSNGTVLVVAEGEEEQLKELLSHLEKGSLFSKVDEVKALWGEYSGEFKSFTIVYSSLWDRL
ncbi:MAG: acylphosphatase [Candidatus Taylorbacteria bacterium CG11_big_fil_rev_8_21_14_0_20_46_11]|uniref:acylphosphatase n=1 Tax=Candidatus Taylorbacteria bacterium CG11_big_fil_rev_8_21_14_0_20_46_11 TaxID=1975025 RepID=A0A2H0KCB8_9BACT|nr:MAG: acylphosphatase [Candidatus Taylorbacteria bacterium CG11_big_fil_rev_8_21_14_0_20_46_11]